ncbi:hypothetical protein N7540_002255 [Penicillium herquei]|nr:hypothetical protein N7540_002255 [Penicillium herquei]
MRVALLTLLCAALVTALSQEEALKRWGGPRGKGRSSYEIKNIGGGNGGGISGNLNVVVGGGGVCDQVACDAKCRMLGDQSGYCDSEIGSADLLARLLGQTTSLVSFSMAIKLQKYLKADIKQNLYLYTNEL